MDILLVLGSVTARQYEPVRLGMLRGGLDPQVIRVGDEYRSSQKFVYDAWEDGSLDDASDAACDRAVAAVTEQFFVDKFGTTDPNEVVKAVVIAEASLEDVEGAWEWLIELFGVEVPIYDVQRRHDNPRKFYLSGSRGSQTDMIDIR